MDLNLSEEDLAFKKEVKDFIESNLTKDVKKRVSDGIRPEKKDIINWQILLNSKGWLAPGWPKKFGGSDWTPSQRYIFDEEVAMANAPQIVPFGVTMVGPVIIEYGTPEQKTKFLPKILNSTNWWCQGYSEPGSGSDLASLKTKAEIKDGCFVVNGTKTWTTHAQYADWMFCLVKTNSLVKPQEGISFILIDMKSEGISVEPIITMGGIHEVNTVYLENVKVPLENLIYDENKGWSVAKFLLSHERTSIAAVGRSKQALRKLKLIAKKEISNGVSLLSDARFRDKLTKAEVNLSALEYSELRIISMESKGNKPGAEASFLKIRGSEIQQEISQLTLEAVGYYGIPDQPNYLIPGNNEGSIGPGYSANAAPKYFNNRKTSIYGGSNEIQKNILAKMVLGL